jgi:UDP-N-acetylmuramoyl-L-alanine---L-glutamate ligase
MIELIVNKLRNKKILILGFGREGQSSLKFLLSHFPQVEIGIADQQPIDASLIKLSHFQRIHLHTGPDYLNSLTAYDVVLKTPGISLRDVESGETIISSQTDLFLEAFSHQVIGVTGTKGKSTTASLIHHMLTASGEHSILTGNIGIPCFDILHQIEDDTWIVFELSANQLENVRHSPHIAVLLTIYEEHLDHFGTFEAYSHAKYNIMRFCRQGDVAICHADFYNGKTSCLATVKLFSGISMDHLSTISPLLGKHNLLNINAALLAVTSAGVIETEALRHLSSFRGLPHRLEYIGCVEGVHYYNDSIATIPEATIAAIEAIGKVHFLLLGGFDRGICYQSLVDYLNDHPIPDIFLTGKAGQRIGELMDKAGIKSRRHWFDNLSNAIETIRRTAQPDDVCLLSPAAASYDQYKNFEQRGDLFREIVLSKKLSDKSND